MKLTKISNLLMIGLALSFAGMGCKTGKKGTTDLDSASRAGEEKPLTGGGTVGVEKPVVAEPGGGELVNWNPDDMNQDRAALAAETIYFDFDSASIRSSEQSKLANVASRLQSDSSAKLLVEGHCDERGTEEYNRSLGERRALAAREALVTLGVSAARIATRSFGEDRPSDSGHDQSAWAKNRRDDFVLLHAK